MKHHQFPLKHFMPFVLAGFFIALLLLILSGYAYAQTGQQITPTDVYYLAKSIDAALIQMYGLSETPFTKKRLSDTLRPRNVYQKALTVVDEFNVLHPGAVDQNQLIIAHQLEAGKTQSGDVYALLKLLRDTLATKDAFPRRTRQTASETEYPPERAAEPIELEEQRTTRTPSDVYHMLRQISWHHQAIAKREGISTDWATPAQVYDAIVNDILPAAQALAENAGLEFEDYAFPRQPISGLIPRYIYKLLVQVYGNIAQYYQQQEQYDPIELIEITECDELSPADVFDLTQVLAAELKAQSGGRSISASTADRYSRWKETHDDIVPGHVFRLVQYTYVLTKRILENELE